MKIVRKIEREHGVRHYSTSGGLRSSVTFGFWDHKGERVLELFIDEEDLWDETRLEELYLTPLYHKGNIAVRSVDFLCKDCNVSMVGDYKRAGWIYCHCEKCHKKVKISIGLTIQGIYK